jgi:molybdopterin biosynthesis enzyme MoaB
LGLVRVDRLEDNVRGTGVARLVAEGDFHADGARMRELVQSLELSGQGVPDKVVTKGKEAGTHADAVQRVSQFVRDVFSTNAGAGISSVGVLREGVKKTAQAEGFEELFRAKAVGTVVLTGSRSGEEPFSRTTICGTQ